MWIGIINRMELSAAQSPQTGASSTGQNEEAPQPSNRRRGWGRFVLQPKPMQSY